MIFSALLLGLISNFHCLGMCGPIALALPIDRTNSWSQLSGIAAYNIGRILIYALFGAIVGSIGHRISIVGWQQKLSVFIGLLIIVSVLFPWIFSKLNGINKISFKAIGKLKSIFQKHLHNPSRKSLFLLGIINGFLPCGMIYIALAGSFISGAVIPSMLYMIAFGIGTLPTMIILPILGKYVQGKVQKKLRKLIPITIFFFGALLLLRGLNLGIPYVSPQLNSTEQVKCH